MVHTNYINKVNFIRRGIRCHGIPFKKCSLIYIRGIRSWHLSKFRRYLTKKFPDFSNSVVAVKHIITVHDNFFLIKSLSSSSEINEFISKFNNFIKSSSLSTAKFKGFSHKVNFSHSRRQFFSSISNDNSASSSVASCSFSANSNKSNSDKYNYSDPDNCYRLLHSEKHKLFSLCLSWNTNGWNYGKRDGIEYFNSLFKPLFLCFQETGNGTDLSGEYPCKVKLPNYKYFCKRADTSIPGLRGLFLFYHRSIQATIENNDLNYIISLSTYSLWNNSKCSIGNIYIPQKKHYLQHKLAKAEVLTWLSAHTSHPSLLIGDFNTPLEKLQNLISNLDDWHLVKINGSCISWISGSRSSAIDHAIVNSRMKELIFSASFVDFPPISDHKPLLIFSEEVPKDSSFVTPKKTVKWNRIKCLENHMDIFDNNKFNVLFDEFDNGNISSNDLYNKFVSIVYSIADDCDLTSTESIQKTMFHMSQKIFDLQKLKMKAYKDIKRLGSTQDLDNFMKLISKYVKLSDIIRKKCNHFRKLDYLHWIKIGCQLAINKDSRKWWKWIKRNIKTGKLSSCTSNPIKNKNGDIVTSTSDQLKVWHDYYKDLSSDPSGHSLYKPYWSNPANKKLYKYYENQEWNINHEISIDEIVQAIESTPNFKASGPDNIPIELFKSLFYRDEDNNIMYGAGLKCFHLLLNRIWNGDFPNFWNKASIVSVPKKGDLSDCNNYRGISLINNIIKILSKIVATRILTYCNDNNIIRPEQYGFRSREECISLFISIREICLRRHFSNKDTYIAFLDLKKAYDTVPTYNILNKIECLGIRGKCLKFIENLYLSSKACVKIDSQFSKAFRIKKGVRQGCPLSPILFNLFINDIFRDCNKYGVSIGSSLCCGGLFADDIVLCAPTRGSLNKLLKKVNDWAKFNHMTFGINKCATMVIKAPDSRVVGDPTFYLAGQPIPKSKCYTYLGIPFNSDLDLKLKNIIKSTTNKVRKALYSIKGFLKNPLVPIKFKELVLKSVVISKVSYIAPLLGSNKINTSSIQRLINLGLYWIGGFSKRNSFISLYNISKDLNIPPMSAKCALAQCRCYTKWKNSKCIIGKLIDFKVKKGKHPWTTQSSRLITRIKNRKKEYGNNIKQFYWDRDVKKSSIKAVSYTENQLELSSGFSKLEIEYPDLAYGFNWLLKLRCGYRFDSIVAKAANIVKDTCPDTCPCCNSGNQTFEHWLLECPMFNYHRSKYLCLTDTSLNNINLNSNDNLLNDNSNYNRNSNVENRTENNINNSSANNIIDHDNSRNLGNNNRNLGNNNRNLENNSRINSDNNVDNESNNECNNTRELVNVTNSVNNENSNINLDSSNNFISIMTRGSNSNSDESSSNWRGVYYFLLGGKKKFNSIGDREWNDLCKCQLKPGSLTDVPFLVRTSALLNHIMPIVSDHLRSLFNRHRKTDLTKRVNAENAVRQSSRDSAINNNDNNFVT